jgi:hypothetical protein
MHRFMVAAAQGGLTPASQEIYRALPMTWCQCRLLSLTDVWTFPIRSFLSRERWLAGKSTDRNDRNVSTAPGVGLSTAEGGTLNGRG